MRYEPDNPLIVQSDHTLLLETMGPKFEAARDALSRFAELVKSPEYIHTYKITPLSLWNAAASGVKVDTVLGALEGWSKYQVPPNVPVSIRETMARYGKLKLLKADDGLVLVADDPILLKEVRGLKGVRPLLQKALDDRRIGVDTGDRGLLKQELLKANHPVEDLAGYIDGAALAVELKKDGWGLRAYQQLAVDAFLGDGGADGGSGVVVLPCGAGKTIVGLATLAKLGMKTLILCTNVTALRQWREEIIARTTLRPEEVGEYSGERKDILPVTISTYQMLTWRKSKDAEFVHFDLFDKENWGLIVYDEVHLLPAPIFRTVAHLQARRRLGLTATLVREDGKQADVFALIGPKRFDVPWKDLEHQGWIATADCTEIRVDLTDEDRLRYAVADDKEKFRIASTNTRKGDVIEGLLHRHQGDRILVIGMYLDQLKQVAERWNVPLITGETPQAKRDALYEGFRSGRAPVLAVSKVGNFSVDIPDANVAIQISGTWGSRQEEAQRLGRILRPKKSTDPHGNTAHFYTIITRNTAEQDCGERRQLFLTEQGYAYRIELHDSPAAAAGK